MKKRKLGIIGGSGLYKMEGFQKTNWKKVKSSWGNPSDEILIAQFEKEEICFIPRHARGHKISPTNINFRANIDALKQLGVTDIISVSAVGSLKEDLNPGTFVIVDQFIDRTFSRIKTFFNPESDPFGSSWNITQSKIAIGSGGVSGKGYQEGSQSHLDFLPETETDFIFAVIAEEFGFIGVCTLMAIYIFILMRCFYLALNARDRFCRLAIGGLSLIFASTLFINLGMVTGLLPVVGMPLPFVSKGGSSLLSFYIAFGIIISMASHKKLMQK